MRRILMIAGLAAAVAAPSMLPSAASARSYCEQRAHDRRVTGTLLGAVGGGLLGNAVSHGGGRIGGAPLRAGPRAGGGDHPPPARPHPPPPPYPAPARGAPRPRRAHPTAP